MDARTLKALKGSIKHWQENSKAKTTDDASTSYLMCPLCSEFIKQGCRGCPVMVATGQTSCEGSPYSEADESLMDWKFGKGRREAFIAAAKEELKFLKSLLPKEEK